MSSRTLTVGNRSLATLKNRAKVKAAWLEKLHSNVGPTLNRIGDIVTLSPNSLNPPKDGEGNRITLRYIGTATNAVAAANDMARIQKVLDGTFDDNGILTVKMKRIVVVVTLKTNFDKKAAA